MNLVILVFGAGGALWRDKLGKALDRLRKKLAAEDVQLTIWGVERSGASDPSSTTVDRWFSVDVPVEMKRLSQHLEQRKVQLAVVASPNETHVGILCSLLDKVPYIVVEKPLSDEPESAQLAVPRTEAAGGSVCKGIDHYLAKPAVRHVLALARQDRLAEEIGDLMEVWFTMKEERAIDPRRAATLNQGLTFDMAIHGFSLLAELLEIRDPERIEIDNVAAAQYRDAPIDGETAARIELHVADGPRATLDIGKGLIDDKRFTLVGTEGTLEVDIDRGTVSLRRTGERAEIVHEAERDDSYDTLMEEAVRGVLDGATPPHPTRWLIEIRAAATALKLVTRARSRFREIETYEIGTTPRIFAKQVSLDRAHVEVYADRPQVERAVAREIVEASREAADRRGRFVLVIPGGTSFLGIGALLAHRLTSVDLSQWEVFFTDEHAGLLHDSGENNYALAVSKGGWDKLTDSGRLRSEQLHRIVTEESGEVLDPDAVSSRLGAYEDVYRAAIGKEPGPDLMILGLGGDCHTASIVPMHDGFVNPLLHSERHYDIAHYPEGHNLSSRLRASITAHGIRAAQRVLLLAFGDAKREAIHEVLTEPIDLEARPGSVIRLVEGTLLTDRAGGAHLEACWSIRSLDTATG